jgi:hypothetical protein
MARADRLERLDIRRADLEAEYTAALVAALQTAAAGSWGLFGHNRDRAAEARVAPVLENLEEIDAAIGSAREQLGLEQFTLHAEFLASRGPVASSAVGEPKQAKAWLAKLGAA